MEGAFNIMKKILAVVLGTMAVSSFADVTLYGRVSAAVENDQFPSNTQVQPGNTSIQDYGSYFGIRGTDQVYGQTAVVWQVEQFLNITSGEAYQSTTGSGWAAAHPGGSAFSGGVPTTGTNVLASSDSYIGLQGGWGRVRIGNLSNTYRTNTGAIDVYNGANANVMGTYDRFLAVLPQMIRFDTPTWSNFSAAAYISANQDGNYNTGGANGNGMNQANDETGYNNAPIYGFGLFYNPGNFSATFNTQIEQNTGIYQCMGGSCPGVGNNVNQTQGINAYSSRLELSYNNPDSWFAGVGAQIAQGYGYQSVPGNGNLNNLWVQTAALNNVNSSYYTGGNSSTSGGWTSLNAANLGTAEIGATVGWHINNWTPKLGYVMGSNMMVGGSPWDLVAGNNQVGATGYQQVVAELDWNITPRTIAFVSWGQQWWGNTMQNMVKGSAPVNLDGTPATDMNAAGGSININNSTTAVGFSHTF